MLQDSFGIGDWKDSTNGGKRTKIPPPKDQRPKRPSAFDLGNEIRKLKKEDSNFMWLNECDSQIPKFVFDNLSKAFQRFWSHSASYPKFKSKKELRQSYSSVSPTVPRLEDGNHLRLAKLGRVKFYNKGYIPDVKLKRATLSTDGIDYYCSVLFDYPVESLPLVNKEVGIDLGLKSTVTCSDGKVFCWNPLKRSLRRIKLSQRHFLVAIKVARDAQEPKSHWQNATDA